jgi:hypothetical protein
MGKISIGRRIELYRDQFPVRLFFAGYGVPRRSRYVLYGYVRPVGAPL